MEVSSLLFAWILDDDEDGNEYPSICSFETRIAHRSNRTIAARVDGIVNLFRHLMLYGISLRSLLLLEAQSKYK